MGLAQNSFSRLGLWRVRQSWHSFWGASRGMAEGEGDPSQERITCVQGKGCSVALRMEEAGPQVISPGPVKHRLPERQICFSLD